MQPSFVYGPTNVPGSFGHSSEQNKVSVLIRFHDILTEKPET
jgi:hypothetical protein